MNNMKKLIFLFLFICSVSLILVNVQVVLADDEEEDGGDIVYTHPLKAVIFSHKAHTSDLGLKCEWCHDETFEMEAGHMEQEAQFDMESLCNERYCGTCHNGDVAFSTTTQCARCHIGVKGYNEMVKEGLIEPTDEPKSLHTEVENTEEEKSDQSDH